MKNSVRKYIGIYMRNNLQTGVLCALLCFVVFFTVSMLYDIFKYDVVFSFIPFMIALIMVAATYLKTFRFRTMISTQEKRYKVRFSEENAEFLCSGVYLSENWLIFAGLCAFYKKNIRSVSSVKKSGMPLMSIKTTDGGRYKLRVVTKDEVGAVNEWLNGQQGE